MRSGKILSEQRKMLARVAHKLAVLHGVRLLPPFTYLPHSSLLNQKEFDLSHSLRELHSLLDVHELFSIQMPLTLDRFLADEIQSEDGLAKATVSRALMMALLSVACDPKQASARITLGAIQLRLGLLQAAEEQFCIAERQSRAYSMQSRAVANRAVVYEVYGDIKGAARLSEIAVQFQKVSSLAIHNHRIYRDLVAEESAGNA